MLDPRVWTPAPLPPEQPPLLTVIVDTEEEFDWSKPLSREQVSVTHMEAQERAHRIYQRFGLRPQYVIDYAVAADPKAAARLREWAAGGLCGIGAHLHPWVTPPHDEVVGNRNSYAGNLPAPLERAKLAQLTDRIEASVGVRPVLYRAGRFGVGAATASALAELGYEIDCSVVPQSDFSAEEGPDFRHCGQQSYWFAANGRRLLELPLSVGFVGALAAAGPALHRWLQRPLGQRARLPGIASRLGLFERIRLSPEGTETRDLIRLADSLLRSGCRTLSLTYHSPTLSPGNTPYVRDNAELERFLGRIEGFLDHFFGRLGGVASTPIAIKRLLEAQA